MKQLRMTVREMKDKCLEGEVTSYAWLGTKEMLADCITKERKMPITMEEVLAGKGMVLN